MFESTKVIIYIGKTSIHAARVGDKAPFTIHEKMTFFYTDAATLLQAFQSIKKKFGEQVRVIVAEELSYVMSLKSEGTAASRNAVQARAQEHIPEKLSETSWDYKVVGSYIEIAAIVKHIHDLIQQTAVKAQLRIETLEPESVSIARYMEKSSTPVLAIYRQDTVRLVVTVFGAVIASHILASDSITAELVQFMTFLKQQGGIEVTGVVSAIGEVALPPELAALKIEKKPLEPMVGMAMKTDIKDTDEESLSIRVDPPSAPALAKPQAASTPSVRSVGMIFAIILLMGLSYWVFMTYIKEPQQSADARVLTPTKAPPTVTPTPIEASASATVERSAYPLVIQNGSGIEGEAGRLAEYLQAEQYTIAETGNADRDDYAGILIQHTASVSAQFVIELDKVLKSFYTDRNAQSEIASGEADITIIIGTSP